jgi:hypothetical protein
MQIKILEVGNVSTLQGKKGAYSLFTLKYEADGKARDRKIMSFAKEVYGELLKSTPNEKYEIGLKQNGDFWDWVSITKLASSDGDSAVGRPAAKSGGNWETSEERARRQVYIMRQNALTNAVAYCSDSATVGQVLKVAAQFAAWSADIEMDDDDDGPDVD